MFFKQLTLGILGIRGELSDDLEGFFKLHKLPTPLSLFLSVTIVVNS